MVVQASKSHPVKEQRGKYRRERHGTLRVKLQGKKRTVLEERSVHEPAEKNYLMLITGLLGWLCVPSLRRPGVEFLDGRVAEYLEDKFFEGEARSFGTSLMAALKWQQPQLFTGTWWPRTQLALKGFRKLAPVFSRLPIPMLVVVGLTSALLSMGEFYVGLGVLLAFHLYLRPGEL